MWAVTSCVGRNKALRSYGRGILQLSPQPTIQFSPGVMCRNCVAMRLVTAYDGSRRRRSRRGCNLGGVIPFEAVHEFEHTVIEDITDVHGHIIRDVLI